MISPCISVPQVYETDATLACHPQVVSQPTNDQSPQDLIEVIQPARDVAEELL